MPTKEKPIGQVTHYFNKIGVAIVKLKAKLEVGQKIHIKGRATDFEQKVKSMQIEHENVEKAKAKEVVGIKVDEPVRENDLVYPAPLQE